MVIKRLQKKVKRLEKKQRERTLRMKLFKIVSTAGDTVNAASVILDVSAASLSTSVARPSTRKATEQEAKDAALIEQMEDVQARIDADALLAERLQQEEREQFTIAE
nr:hypothetical protein [Tanacetum cinerariifolium]